MGACPGGGGRQLQQVSYGANLCGRYLPPQARRTPVFIFTRVPGMEDGDHPDKNVGDVFLTCRSFFHGI